MYIGLGLGKTNKTSRRSRVRVRFRVRVEFMTLIWTFTPTICTDSNIYASSYEFIINARQNINYWRPLLMANHTVSVHTTIIGSEC